MKKNKKKTLLFQALLSAVLAVSCSCHPAPLLPGLSLPGLSLPPALAGLSGVVGRSMLPAMLQVTRTDMAQLGASDSHGYYNISDSGWRRRCHGRCRCWRFVTFKLFIFHLSAPQEELPRAERWQCPRWSRRRRSPRLWCPP